MTGSSGTGDHESTKRKPGQTGTRVEFEIRRKHLSFKGSAIVSNGKVTSVTFDTCYTIGPGELMYCTSEELTSKNSPYLSLLQDHISGRLWFRQPGDPQFPKWEVRTPQRILTMVRYAVYWGKDDLFTLLQWFVENMRTVDISEFFKSSEEDNE